MKENPFVIGSSRCVRERYQIVKQNNFSIFFLFLNKKLRNGTRGRRPLSAARKRPTNSR